MIKTTFERDNVDVNGTCLQGYIECTYNELRETFGEPGEGDGYKVQAEWCGKTSDGTVFTIYDWKEYETPPEQVTEWHIGGHNKRSVEAVHGLMKYNH